MKMLERSVILMYDRSNSPTDIDSVNLELFEKATVVNGHPASTGCHCRTQKACLVSSGVHHGTTCCTQHKHKESFRLISVASNAIHTRSRNSMLHWSLQIYNMLYEDNGVFMCLNLILTRLLIEQLNFVHLCKEFQVIVKLLIVQFHHHFKLLSGYCLYSFPSKLLIFHKDHTLKDICIYERIAVSSIMQFHCLSCCCVHYLICSWM